MEIKIQKNFMLKLHKEGGEITYRELKTWMATGWKRRKTLLRWKLTTLIVCLMQVDAPRWMNALTQ